MLSSQVVQRLQLSANLECPQMGEDGSCLGKLSQPGCTVAGGGRRTAKVAFPFPGWLLGPCGLLSPCRKDFAVRSTKGEPRAAQERARVGSTAQQGSAQHCCCELLSSPTQALSSLDTLEPRKTGLCTGRTGSPFLQSRHAQLYGGRSATLCPNGRCSLGAAKRFPGSRVPHLQAPLPRLFLLGPANESTVIHLGILSFLHSLISSFKHLLHVLRLTPKVLGWTIPRRQHPGALTLTEGQAIMPQSGLVAPKVSVSSLCKNLRRLLGRGEHDSSPFCPNPVFSKALLHSGHG